MPVIAVGPDAVECNPTRPLLFNDLSDDGGLWIAEKHAFFGVFRTLHISQHSPLHPPPLHCTLSAAFFVIKHLFQWA